MRSLFAPAEARRDPSDKRSLRSPQERGALAGTPKALPRVARCRCWCGGALAERAPAAATNCAVPHPDEPNTYDRDGPLTSGSGANYQLASSSSIRRQKVRRLSGHLTCTDIIMITMIGDQLEASATRGVIEFLPFVCSSMWQTSQFITALVDQRYHQTT